MISGLLATKLRRPSMPPQQVPRPQLSRRLDEGLQFNRPLTLVSAPAGFGKTTCISEWVDTLSCPVAWLSLDAADDEPGRFFTYLLAALQQVDEHLGREIEGILRAGQLPPAEIVSTTLINDILNQGTRFLLVLDDLQVIQDRFIFNVLQTLVTNLPPALHLVLLTREEPSLPLARLRANNQLTAIRAADLRFTNPEAAYFLNKVMDLSLSPADVAALEHKTEGWIVGLQLAGLSVRDRADPADFIATLSGSHRFILSYLTEEVLNQQPADIQAFLLQTSILDRLNGDLCNAVTGRADSRLLLEQLFNANLFLIPLDDEQHWYRYHQLFADLLRDRQNTLHPTEIPNLHRRAGHWYAQAGMSNEAIQHALAAADYALAVELIEKYAMDLLMQWHKKTVAAWMQTLPPQWAAKSPKTNFAFAWMHLFGGDYIQATPYLEQLQTIFSGSEAEKDPALQAEWLALQATLLNARQQPTKSLALAKQALEIVPKKEAYVHSLIYMGLAGAYQQLDDYAHAVEAYRLIIRHGQAAGSFVSQMLGTAGLGLLALERGHLHFAFEIASQGLELVERSGSLPPLSAAVYGELGQIHYYWHQLEQAHLYFRRATQVSTLSGYSDAEIYHGVIFSRLHHIEGNLAAAAQEIQNVVDLMHADAPVVVREEVVAQQVRVYLAQHRLPAAETALKQHGFHFKDKLSVPNLIPGQNINRPAGLLYNSALRILLHRVQARHESARLTQGIELAGRLLAELLRRQLIPVALETLLLRAQLHTALGNSQAGMADYEQALTLAQPEGFISVFVEEGPLVATALQSLLKNTPPETVRADYLKTILAAFPASEELIVPAPAPAPSAPAEALVEPLSRRELEVLQLMGEGYSNEEIANRLVITLHTVKKHSSNIFTKLGVSSRTQAFARARQLKLL